MIDCHNLCWIAYHGIGELDYHGLRTGVAFAFMRDVFKYANQFNTHKLLFCWDSSKSYRKKIYPQYKENRSVEEDPQELAQRKAAMSQFKMVRREILPDLGFKNIYRRSGYEADDLIAKLVAEHNKQQFVIISSDNDLFQCLDYHVDIWSPKKKTLYTRRQFEKDFDGLHPWWWIKIKAYAGCSTDNIKGIEGVGEKKAYQYCHGQLPEGKIKKRIESKESEKIFKRNLRLVALPFKGPKSFELPIRKEDFNLDNFVDTFDRLGFFSFLKKEELDKWKKRFKLEESPQPTTIKKTRLRRRRNTPTKKRSV